MVGPHSRSEDASGLGTEARVYPYAFRVRVSRFAFRVSRSRTRLACAPAATPHRRLFCGTVACACECASCVRTSFPRPTRCVR